VEEDAEHAAQREKHDQELFDDEVARMSGRVVVIFGGLGIVAALLMSTIALLNSNSASTTTVTVRAAARAPTVKRAPALTGDALGAQLFVSGNPSTGAIGCGSCHTMKAAGATGAIGPNLDKELTADPAADTLESVVDPNKEIVPGYSANIMPTNYGTALTTQQLNALVHYVYDSTNLKAKAKAAKTGSTTP
jgi:mono/diheme cytochrome c family protein